MLYKVKGCVRFDWIENSHCPECNALKETEYSGVSEDIDVLIEANTDEDAISLALDDWVHQWERESNGTVLREHWTWCDVTLPAEDVLMRRQGAPMLPLLECE